MVIILARELAIQVSKSFNMYGKNIFKNSDYFWSVGKMNQVKTLKNGADIVIATFGRLLDLIKDTLIPFLSKFSYSMSSIEY